MSPELVVEMIDYNVKLVWLNEAVIPETIISVMNNQEYKTIDVDYLRGSYKVLCDEDTGMAEIFEGI